MCIINDYNRHSTVSNVISILGWKGLEQHRNIQTFCKTVNGLVDVKQPDCLTPIRHLSLDLSSSRDQGWRLIVAGVRCCVFSCIFSWGGYWKVVLNPLVWYLVLLSVIRTVLLVCKPFVGGHGAHQAVSFVLLLCFILITRVDIFAVYCFFVVMYMLIPAPWSTHVEFVNKAWTAIIGLCFVTFVIYGIIFDVHGLVLNYTHTIYLYQSFPGIVQLVYSIYCQMKMFLMTLMSQWIGIRICQMTM